MLGKVILSQIVIPVEVQFTGEVELVAVITRVFFYSKFE
jgi:hypothetical protein